MYGSNTRCSRPVAMVGSAGLAVAARYGRLVFVLSFALLASLVPLSVRGQATLDDVVDSIDYLTGELLFELQDLYRVYSMLDAWDLGQAVSVSLENADLENLSFAVFNALDAWSSASTINVQADVDPWSLNDASVDDPDDFDLPDPEPTIEGFTGNFGQVQTEVMNYQSDRQQIELEIIDSGGSIWDKLKARVVGIFEAFSVTEPTGIYWVVGDWTLVDLSATDFYDFAAVRNVMPFVWGAVFLFGSVRIIQRGVA